MAASGELCQPELELCFFFLDLSLLRTRAYVCVCVCVLSAASGVGHRDVPWPTTRAVKVVRLAHGVSKCEFINI